MLTHLEKIREAVEKRPLELAKAREAGKKVVGYFCSYVPEEIIHALGLLPVRLEYGGDEQLVDIGGRFISKNNCVFVREAVGMFAEKRDPFVKNADVLAVATTCLQIYRVAELINYFFHIPTAILVVPRNFYLPEGRRYFREETANFATQMEAFAGRKLDATALKESVDLYRHIRRALQEIYEYQARNPSPIGWQDVFNLIHAGFYLDKEHYLSLLKGLLGELKAQALTLHRNSVAFDEEKPRIFLAGSIIARGDTKLINIIEKMGGRVVVDDLCTGNRFFAGLEVKEPTIESIADAYLDKVPCASLPYPVDLETDRRLEYMGRLIDTYRPEGMIYHTLRYCDPFTFKAFETKQFFKDKVAFLEIHTEYARSDEGSIMTRVEAFMELIVNRRISQKLLVTQ